VAIEESGVLEKKERHFSACKNCLVMQGEVGKKVKLNSYAYQKLGQKGRPSTSHSQKDFAEPKTALGPSISLAR